MKTDISKTRYTPLIDNLVHDVGILGAAVFGRVWRYCQMERGYCHAEQGRIADELELSRGKVNECLRELVEKGYLGTTKNTKGRTVIYYDTGKAGKVELPEFTLPEDVQNTEPVTEPVTVSVTEPVTNGYTKKVKKEKRENTTTSSSADSFLNSFLKTASQEQVKAYELVIRFSSQEKALEIAQRENPYEAAIDYLEWRAENGGKAAKKILDEHEKKENAVWDKEAHIYSECIQYLETCVKEYDTACDYHIETYKGTFDNYFMRAVREERSAFVDNYELNKEDIFKNIKTIALHVRDKHFPEFSHEMHAQKMREGFYV
jgi:DNA-binding MarR family transcriptional regulator